MAVKQLLKQALGPETKLCHDEHGAPVLPEHPGIYISISHSTNICCIVTSDHPIGIDIEAPRQQLLRIAHKFLTANERETYEKLTATNTPADEILNFLVKLWTAKEATFKAASIPDLVVSEIDVSPDFSSSETRGIKFTITYSVLPCDETIAIAIPVKQ